MGSGWRWEFGESTPNQSLVFHCHPLGSSICTLPSFTEVNLTPVVEATSLCYYPLGRKMSTQTHIFSFAVPVQLRLKQSLGTLWFGPEPAVSPSFFSPWVPIWPVIKVLINQLEALGLSFPLSVSALLYLFTLHSLLPRSLLSLHHFCLHGFF